MKAAPHTNGSQHDLDRGHDRWLCLRQSDVNVSEERKADAAASAYWKKQRERIMNGARCLKASAIGRRWRSNAGAGVAAPPLWRIEEGRGECSQSDWDR